MSYYTEQLLRYFLQWEGGLNYWHCKVRQNLLSPPSTWKKIPPPWNFYRNLAQAKTRQIALFILQRHIHYTAFYYFHQINFSKHNNILTFEITAILLNKDDLVFVDQF